MTKVIPESIVIDYNDPTPFHEIPMYKKLVRYYIGLTTRTLSLNLHGLNGLKKNNIVKGSFPKNDETSLNTSYKSCDGKDYKSITYPIEEDVEFIYKGNYNCYIFGCSKTIHVYRYLNTLFICSGTGERYFDYHDFYNTYGQTDSNLGQNVFSFDMFLEMLDGIKSDIIECNQICFFGHSAGMASSILSSFLLCCIKNNEFYEKNKSKFKDGKELTDFFKDMKTYFSDVCEAIRNITLFVCGTGGYPILFEDEDEFKLFFDEMKGRYVHIVDGYKKDDENIHVDYFSSPISSLINLKFGLYYIDDVNDGKYEGNQCSYGVVFDNVIIENWIKTKQPNGYIYFIREKETTYLPNSLLNIQNKMTKNKIIFVSDNPKEPEYDPKYINLHDFKMYRKILVIYFFRE